MKQVVIVFSIHIVDVYQSKTASRTRTKNVGLDLILSYGKWLDRYGLLLL